MKKVRCPRCFVVNMERFVTFPYCAGCGARLPVGETAAASAWRRPLGVFLWTSTFGVALLALFVAVRVFEAPFARAQDVSILGRGPRSVQVGDEFVLRLNIEAAEGTARRNPMLQMVELRVLRDSLNTLNLLEVQPQPDTVNDRGRARYFGYATLDSDGAIKLRLRATQPGHQSVQMLFYVERQLQGVSTFSFDVSPRDAKSAQEKAPRESTGVKRFPTSR